MSIYATSAEAALHAPTARSAPETARRLEARPVLSALSDTLIALFIFFICFTFLRPSPYDFAAGPAMLLPCLLGLRFHRAALVFAALLLLYHLGLVTALMPYLDEVDPTAWTLQSLYLMATCIFFVAYFTDDTKHRFDIAIRAYVASCVFAGAAGILSYFGDGGVLFTMDGRAAGVFEDPNVLGSFLILGLLYLVRNLLVGESRFPLLSAAAAAVIAVGVFLSFSRGSWGSLVLGLIIMLGFTYRASQGRIRRRIAVITVAAVTLAVVGLAGLMTISDVAETVHDRFVLTKDYDEGVTGRFGNQLRSIPLLIERPGGFGPLRFRLRYGLEPHNSYIGGFANGGWLGGFAFIGLALTTAFVGIRLCLVPSPFRSRAHVVVPATLMFLLQAFQIDIDHWRHVYLMLGMVWGLESARVRWARRVPAAAVPSRDMEGRQPKIMCPSGVPA